MSKLVLIWDLPTRLFHWLLATSFALTYVFAQLGSDYIDWHLRCGYVVLGLMIYRVVWGLIGTKYARFSALPISPKHIIGYLKTFNEQADENTDNKATNKYLGHNPLGSLMVLFFVISLLLQAGSGLFMDDEIFTTGPYVGYFGESFDQIMSTIHHNLADGILIAVVLHIIAVVFYLKIKRQNLIKPMLTGKKSVNESQVGLGIKNSRLLIATILAIIVFAFVYWLVVINAPVIESWY